MKKILSILMILVLVGGTVFAQTEASYSGEATLSWGIDLGNGKDKDGDAKIAHGFKNEGSATVTLPFVKKGSGKTFGEGDIYAFLDISGVELGLKADRKDSQTYGKIKGLEAKIVIKKFYVTVYDAPNMTTSYAHRIVDGKTEKFKNGFGGYGTKIGYADKDMYGLDVGVKFVSNGSWEDRGSKEETKKITEKKEIVKGTLTGTKYTYTAAATNEKYEDLAGNEVKLNSSNQCDHPYLIKYTLKDKVEKKAVPAMNSHYGFGIDFSMEPVKDYLKIDAGFNMTFDKKAKYQKGIADIAWDDSSIINFGVKLTSSPINNKEEKETLTFDLGFDGGTNYKWTKANGDKADEFAWALGFGAKYSKPIVGTFDAGLYVASESTPYGRESVFKLPDTKGGVDMAMTVGYKGLFFEKNLDVHARLTANHLFSKINEDDAKNNKIIPMTFNFGASYKFDKLAGKDYMWVKPYGDIWGKSNCKDYEDYTSTDGKNKYFVGLAYKLGVAFQPMEHLVVDAAWAHGKLNPDTGKVDKSMNHNAHNGTFILSATISY